jgi:hypothetical protein
LTKRKKVGRHTHTYRAARRNAARANRWRPLAPVSDGGTELRLRTTWHQYPTPTDQRSRSHDTPILSDGTLDYRFRGRIRPNEKRLK